MADRDQFVSEFISITAASAEDANKFGERSNWDVADAITAYYRFQEQGMNIDDEEDDEGDEVAAGQAAQAPSTYQGPRRLDGTPATEYQGTASSSSKPAKKKTGLATLSSLGGGHGHDHDHDDDDDDDDEDDDGRGDLYAGGEKSGLSVQDPKTGAGPSGTKKAIRDIIARARQNVPRPEMDDDDEAGPSTSRFRGAGQTLGGEGVESRTIPDPSREQDAPVRRSGPPTQRTLHLWQNGFSVDDGPLHDISEPRNAAILEMIRGGTAPLHLLGVQPGEPVDVTIDPQPNEVWRQLPRIYRPFGGEGRRLGSLVPEISSAAALSSIAGTVAAAAPASASAPAPTSTVDESQPTITIRIQMPDATRLPARFNTTQTIGDVYDFVQGASVDTRTRAWVLSTTFPTKDHSDKSLVLGDMPEFKRGGTAVVKWV